MIPKQGLTNQEMKQFQDLLIKANIIQLEVMELAIKKEKEWRKTK